MLPGVRAAEYEAGFKSLQLVLAPGLFAPMSQSAPAISEFVIVTLLGEPFVGLTVSVAGGELVLLKSCLPAAGIATLEQAADAGYIDRCFPELAAKLPLVRLVNLRDSDFAEMRLTSVPGSAWDCTAREALPRERSD